MTEFGLTKRAAEYLRSLCLHLPTRRVGSDGNRAATSFVAQRMASFGFHTECPEFECIDWEGGGARLLVQGESFQVRVSPYSLGCRAHAPLVVVSTVEELAAVEAEHKIIVLRGDIAKEQLMPKNFMFYNPDEHKRIIHLLETKKPQAIVAATSRNPDLAGALYPFPLIEDGDFDIPSVYMTEEEGSRLALYAGAQAKLDSIAQRIPARGCNVIARRGSQAGQRVVLCAHIDSKAGTPGALDNATGIVLLLLLAGLLERYDGRLGIELVAFNGEDYYSATGEVLYLQSNLDGFGQIVLAINMDGVGYGEGRTAYSLYGCPDQMAATIRRVLSANTDMVEGDAWYQGDHMIFVQNQVAALAMTSERAIEIASMIAHTDRDTPDLVDCARLANVAMTLHELLLHLDAIVL